MSNPSVDSFRRRLLKLSLLGIVSAPFSRLVPAQGTQVDEADPTAQQLNYKHDASQVSDPKREPEQFCDNCQLYQAQAGDEWGGCPLFQDKLVHSKGWCNAWVPKSG